MDEDKNILENYLDKKLSKPEIDELKNSNETDLEELKLVKSIVSGVKVNHKLALKAELKGMLADSKLKNKETKTVNFKPWIYSAAASVAVIIVLAIVFFNLNNSVDYNELYAVNYKPYTIASTSRGDTDEKNVAFAFYNNGEYYEAIRLLQQHLEKEPNNLLFKMLLANSYMNTENWNEAIVLLEDLANNEDQFYVQYSNWYLGLAYLKKENLQQAKVYLQNVVSQQMIHEVEAKSILDKLD